MPPVAPLALPHRAVRRAILAGAALLAVACQREASGTEAPASQVAMPQTSTPAPSAHSTHAEHAADVDPPAHAATKPPGSAPLPIALQLPKGALRPKLALYVRDPWALVLGAEIPLVALYDDGTMVRLEQSDQPAVLMQGEYTESVDTLLAGLEQDVAPLPAMSSVGTSTDLPSVTMLFEGKGGWYRRQVYGLTANGDPALPGRGPTPPEPFVRVLRSLRSATLAGAAPYHPAQVDLILWGFEHSKVPPVAWPSWLPAPAKATPPTGGGTLKHTVDGALLPKIQEFQRSLPMQTAVLLQGHKWSLSHRILVPADAELRRIHRELAAASAPRPTPSKALPITP